MALSFDSVGAGNRATGSSATLGTSWSHTIASSDSNTCVIVGVAASHASTAAGTFTCSVTYGGVAMTHIAGSFGSPRTGSTSSTNGAGIAFLYLFNPPTGAQTVAVTTGGTTVKASVIGQSVAYQGVKTGAPTVGNFSVNTTATANPSISTSPPALGAAAILLALDGASITAVSHTSRYINGGSVTGFGDYMAINETITSSFASLTMGITAASASTFQVMVFFLPAPAPTNTSQFLVMF